MTPDEYELMTEQMEDLAAEVREHSQKSGRAIREILAAMRDEGYIACTDDALERCAKLAETPH